MTATLGKKLSTFKKIIYNLWILISLIPPVNGMGLVYAGSKTSSKAMITEGLILEIPWIVLLSIFGIINITGSYPSESRITGIIVLFIIVSIIFSIIISSLNTPKYEKAIEEGKYRKSNSKIISLCWLIVTCIPFINGIPFIYLGIKHSKSGLKIEGALYEIPWILFILIAAVIYIGINLGSADQLSGLFDYAAMAAPLFMCLALILQLISIARLIILNYKNDYLSYGSGGSPSKYAQKSSKPEYATSFKEEPASVKKPSFDSTSRYKSKIDNLTNQYSEKEEKVLNLIDKRFENSGITHERFMGIVNNAHENFYSQRNIALELIELSDDDILIEDKIKQKISFLELIISKMGDLQTELIIYDVEDKKTDEELDELMDDMKVLIDSVKKYE